jgi:hypothetical protein
MLTHIRRESIERFKPQPAIYHMAGLTVAFYHYSLGQHERVHSTPPICLLDAGAASLKANPKDSSGEQHRPRARLGHYVKVFTG